ncbi:T9SS type B sorting domain-containing protein [Aureivirga marina]|uniref:T9SS type B sorting domain-containing protein n=1 Tax=Aureivirga marina TaxID=1182451 RepID=UPI0018CBBC40|nr:T9SS type B sorting domain-containing protein [Aureivirga marina]
MKTKYIFGYFFLCIFQHLFAQIQVESYVSQKEIVTQNPVIKLDKNQNINYFNAPKLNLENKIVNFTPTITNTADFNYGICDDIPYDGIYTFNLGIFQSLVETNPNYHYDYYPTNTDAINQTNELPDLYTSGNAIIYIRIHDITNPNLWAVYTLSLEVINNNTISIPVNLIECEENGSGTATFDLTVNNAVTIDPNPIIKYYTDAALTNEITNPTAFVGTHSQIIYMKIINEYVCEATGYFYLNVIPPPTINGSVTVHACDDDGDGVETFNLTNITAGTFILSFYEDINLTSEISNLTTYVASNNTNVFIKVENQYGCHSTLLLILAVHEIPNLNPISPISLCDNDGNNQEIFDINSLNSQITNDASVSIQYFSNSSFTNEISGNYLITTNQIVYVLATDSNGCENTMEIEFSLNSELNLNPITPISLCDNDGNNQENFDLNSLNSQITNDNSVSIQYFSDASFTNEILGNYSITTNQIVYVLATDSNGCENTMEIEFSLNSELNLNPIAPISLCDNDGNNQEVFDLDSLNSQITNDASVSIQYFSDASFTNEITGNYTITTNQIVYVLATDSNGCENTSEIEFSLNSELNLNQIAPISLCDNDGNNQEIFDLNSLNSQITNDASVSIQYFFNSSFIIEIPGNYLITTNQIVYVLATDSNGCENTMEIEFSLNSILNLNPIAPISLCDNDGNNQEVFDLNSLNSQITNDASVSIQYFSDASFTNEILGNYIITANQIVYVLATDSNGCENTMQIEFSLNSELYLNPILPIYLCDNDGNNQEAFDLNSLNSQITNDASVSIQYFSDASFTNEITGNYTITTNQIVYVLATDSNGCENTMQIEFSLNSELNLNPIAPISLCDNDGNNQENFNLNSLNSQITNDTSVSIQYFSDISFLNEFTGNYTITTNQIVYVLATDSNGCENTMEIEFSLNSELNLNPIAPISLCDNDGNNQENFNLNSLNSQITNDTSVSIQYFSDASFTNEITGNYSITTNQTVYVLATDSNGCENTMEIEFSLNPILNLNPISPISLCDNDGNNLEVFDLNSLNSQITNDASVSIQYFSDASFTNEISGNYSISENQIVYVLATDSNGCENTMEIEFSLNSELNLNPISPIFLCDNDGNNQENFDLNSLNSQITNDASVSIQYFSDISFLNEITGDYTITTNQIVYVLATDSNGCENTMEIEFSLNSELNLNPIAPISLCDNDGNNQENFDLNSLNSQITNDASVSIQYFSDASFTNEIPGNYTITGNQIVYVLATDSNGCENTMQIEFSLNPTLNLNPISPISLCDNDGNNQEIFDLNSLNSQITNDASVSIQYFSDISFLNEITGNYIITANQIVYVLATDSNGCENTMQIEFSLNPTLNLNPISPISLCDNDGNNQEVFDLNSLNSQITNDASVSIQYFSDISFTNEIPGNYTITTNQIVYVLTTDSNGCENTMQIEFSLNPTLNLNPIAPISLCDNDGNNQENFDLNSLNSQITNDASVSIQYFSDASFTNEISGNYSISGNQIVYVLATDSNGCENTMEIEFSLNPTLNLNPISPISLCDNDGNNQEIFDLNSLNSQITNDASVSIQYFSDASFTNEITGNYTITTNQIVYVLATDSNGCENTMEIEFSLNNNVDFNSVSEFSTCNTYDETGYFNLSELSFQFTQNPEIFITYFEDQNFANSINNLSNYQGFQGQEIFVKLENSEGCFSTTSVLLIINSESINTLENIENCSNQNIDLTIQNEIISDSNQTNIQYFTDENFTEIIDSPENFIGINNQEIFVEAIFQNGCIKRFSFQIFINTISANTPIPLYSCDVNNDGFTSFNLTLKNTEIYTALGDFEIKYFVEFNDANEINPNPNNHIQNPENYINIDANSQIIFARVENLISGCFTVVSLELIAESSPEMLLPDSLSICDDENPNGFSIFDLTILESNAIGNFKYYFTENAAIQGNSQNSGWISNPENFVNNLNPQTIWIRMENENECPFIKPIELFVEETPILQQPSSYEICDNALDGDETNGFVNSFYLYEKDAEILNGTTGIVTYHENSYEGPIIDKLNPYTNLTQGTQAVYAVVTNENGCFSYVILDLVVNPLPDVENIEQFSACDDDYDGNAHFDLNEVSELYNLQEEYEISYHITFQNAENNELPISIDESYFSVSQIIFTRIENQNTSCFIIKPLELIITEIPENIIISDEILCEEDQDGFAFFNLNSKKESILEMYPNLEVSMYLTEENATNKELNIDLETPFLNTIPNTQTIWIRLENENNCFIISSFEILIEQKPNATLLPPIKVCDDDYDGFAFFDLESTENQILNGQLGTIVSFHLTEENAENNIESLEENYINYTVNSQEIYVRVENVTTGCFDISTLTLVVEPLPKPNFEFNSIVVCDDDFDGFSLFNLESYIPEFTNQQNGISVTFHENLEDAELQNNAIESPENYISSSKTIYATIINNLADQNCAISFSIELIVEPIPNFNNIETYTFCEDNSDGIIENISLQELTSIFISESNFSNLEVNYFFSQTDAENDFPNIVNPITITNNPETSIFIKAKNLESQCSSIKEIILKVASNPEINETISPLFTCGMNGIGIFNLEEKNEEITSEENLVFNYYFTENDVNNQENKIENFTELESGNTLIWVSIENENLCKKITSFEIIVEETPSFEIAENFTFCKNLEENILTIDNPNGNYMYKWTLPNGTIYETENEFLEINSEGVYTVEAINYISNLECFATHTVDISLSELAEISENTIQQIGYLQNEEENTLIIDISTLGIGEYQFSIDEGISWNTTGIFENCPDGVFDLIIQDIHGCGEIRKEITFLNFPSYFTPNNDGIHDTWHLHGAENIKNITITIFDRYGKIIEVLNQNSDGWNGTKNGTELPSTDYWFILEIKNLNEKTITKKGHFSLIRR